MIHHSIEAALGTDTGVVLARFRQWCVSSGVSATEGSILLRQVESTLAELRSSALAVSSIGSTFQATRSINTDNYAIDVTLTSEPKGSRLTRLFGWIGLR
jgi:hypothetical protein